jgi:hypothetical protein
MISSMVRWFAPPIRVHIWGGFGSQLFGLVIAWRLSTSHRYRRVKLVFHTSGVSERVRELPLSWLSDYSINEIQDFAKSGMVVEPTKTTSISKTLITFLNSVLIRIGLLARANTNLELTRLQPWVLALRGHYTEFRLEDFEVTRLMNLFEIPKKRHSDNVLSIHYRLGDLLNLSSKSYIQPPRISKALIHLSPKNIPVVIFSDSDSEDVSSLLASHLKERGSSYLRMSPIDTIRSCVNSMEFLGTNSKLSLWIAIFRLKENRITAIPKELLNHLNNEIDLQNHGQNLSVY